MPGVAGKHAYKVFLTPEYVEYIRSQWGDAQFMENGLSGLLDGYLKVLTKTMKKAKAVDKKARIDWLKILKEILMVGE